LTTKTRHSQWQRLEGKVAADVYKALELRTSKGGRIAAPEVNDRIVSYLESNIIGQPWADQLVLLTAVMTLRRNDVSSIITELQKLHPRFKTIFSELGFTSFAEWDVDNVLPIYLQGGLAANDSISSRYNFQGSYTRSSKAIRKWIDSLPADLQPLYEKYGMPQPNPLLIEGIIRSGEITNRQKQARKEETDALVSRFPLIRFEAHIRHNKICRLRDAFNGLVRKIEEEGMSLPVSFSYEDGGDPSRNMPNTERLRFRIWNKRAFLLEHSNSYSRNVVKNATYRMGTFSKEREQFFLEFLGAERIADEAPVEGLWFEELLRSGALSKPNDKGIESQRSKFLREWGYVDKSGNVMAHPFSVGVSGVISWGTENGASAFFLNAAKRAEGVFIPIEQMYAAAKFGLIAIDEITGTGMRINELLQTRYNDDCLVRLILNPPPEAKDQTPRVRYALRLIPKGERTDTASNFFIGAETVRLLAVVARFLEEHYSLNTERGEQLPSIPFCKYQRRSHRFGKGRYVYQYNYKHMSAPDVSACIRFLLHGLLFKTADGKLVVMKPHLLRHAFATFAVHVAKVSVDIVREMLKQNNLEVTKYYSQPTDSIIAEAVDQYLARIATTLDTSAIVLRSPEELQKQFEEAKKTVGTMTQVTGGDCTHDGLCYGQFMCVGCPSKVPDPVKRYQVLEKKSMAQRQLKIFMEEGQVAEAEQMKKLLRDCEAELAEMEQIETYRKDERRGALIQIEPRRKP
jgi:integrase